MNERQLILVPRWLSRFNDTHLLKSLINRLLAGVDMLHRISLNSNQCNESLSCWYRERNLIIFLLNGRYFFLVLTRNCEIDFFIGSFFMWITFYGNKIFNFRFGNFLFNFFIIQFKYWLIFDLSVGKIFFFSSKPHPVCHLYGSSFLLFFRTLF